MKRTAEAVWNGSGTEGSGKLTTPHSKAFVDLPYSLKLRFENEDGTKGTNPEELIAAAHAGCYAMALSVALEESGYTADSIETKAVLSLDQVDDGWAITTINLKLDASVPDISDDEFDKLANGAKAGCPVSKVLNAEITLDYTLN
ncbi:OsmC family protein [Rhodohalobacter sulfatireducens]|uniref:OsmC family protein n=1 Tax=Rhodohalobacter sulfatireducens TaxID=2911366 RepID=A0ABS9K957_9BACT|nr:OsmC family protein [Rhodohalobacter sulfatireducens]MCG2587380.1 OsmC family protein [Rhodohalobacter sulfatireducens]